MLVKAKGELQAISASRLNDGIAIWLTQDHRWAETIAEAGVFKGEAIQQAIQAAQVDVAARRVVDVYPLDVEIVDGRAVPLHVRERMKALGPSVRADLGKQAEISAQFSL